jgi:tRNA pseudouridine55 synthase
MDGLILVHKPKGKTSHDVVLQIRSIMGEKKVGHFGTLDPLATGLLLIAVGKATRLFPYFLHLAKTYEGRIRLGIATETYDSEGKPLSQESKKYPDQTFLLEHMSSFQGEIEQLPPPYSAKKYKGEALYRRVRQNKEFILKSNKVYIHDFRLKDYSPPYVAFQVKCSSGTYIRSLAHDLGQNLGCGAHLDQLVRTEIGEYNINQSHTVEQIEKMFSKGQAHECLQPIECLLPELPKIVVNDSAAKLVRSGSEFALEGIALSKQQKDLDILRIFDSHGKLLALARKKPDEDAMHPFLVFDPNNTGF